MNGRSLLVPVLSWKAFLAAQLVKLEAFLEKVGSSINELEGAVELDWSSKSLTGADCKVIAHLAASGAMPNLETLKYAQPLTALSTSARPFVHCQ